MSGVFAEWQPVYAEHGIATFPVSIVGKDKKPAVKGYLKLGSKVSGQLAIKFPGHDAIGLACKRNKITVLDVDTPDERVLADGLAKHGPTPFIVRSGSGNFQAWYRRNGEGRRIRPDPAVPVDILGDGYVVAPPSRGSRGIYEIISGKLDDLDGLPVMRPLQVAAPIPLTNDNAPGVDLSTVVDISPPARVSQTREGNRNDTLWRQSMIFARHCGNIEELMGAAMQYNREEMCPALPAEEVLKIVASAWGYEVEGKNWFGYGPRVVFAADEVDNLMDDSPDAFILLTKIRRHHWGRDFVIANAMAEQMPGGGWRRHRFAAARQYLIDKGEVEEVRPASRQHGPAVYRLKGGRK